RQGEGVVDVVADVGVEEDGDFRRGRFLRGRGGGTAEQEQEGRQLAERHELNSAARARGSPRAAARGLVLSRRRRHAQSSSSSAASLALLTICCWTLPGTWS